MLEVSLVLTGKVALLLHEGTEADFKSVWPFIFNFGTPRGRWTAYVGSLLFGRRPYDITIRLHPLSTKLVRRRTRVDVLEKKQKISSPCWVLWQIKPALSKPC